MNVGSVAAGEWGRQVAEEYFALHLYLEVVLHRRDWLLGVIAANDPRRLLYELALETNGRRPASSPADWSGRLSQGQRLDLLEIPSCVADRQGVLDAHLAGRRIFVEHGREILQDAWPTEMETVIVRRVDRAIAQTAG